MKLGPNLLVGGTANNPFSESEKNNNKNNNKSFIACTSAIWSKGIFIKIVHQQVA